MSNVKIEGFEDVLKNLNKEIKGIKDRSVAGLKAAGEVVKGEAQNRVPVEHGYLKGSAYVRTESREPPAVSIGFSASYAIYVHENLEQKLKGDPRPSGLGVYWGPKGEPKFLENALTHLKAKIVEIVRDYAKVK